MSERTDVLPFVKDDRVNGVGPIERIISLDEYSDEGVGIYDGLCRDCGYDRGDLNTHTEVDAGTITCRNCQRTLHSWE